MSDKPILFSGPMVRALLGGTKTQTRRIIKPQPIVEPSGAWRWEGRHGGFVGASGTHVDEGFPESAKHWNRIQPGDRLWVRETWNTDARNAFIPPSAIQPTEPVWYAADGSCVRAGEMAVRETRNRPGIHMPRWASRITLTVTDVRVQRLQEIRRDDAMAEGTARVGGGMLRWENWSAGIEGMHGLSPEAAYALLWNHINGPGSWDANPWVAAYTFTVELGNIDTLARLG